MVNPGSHRDLNVGTPDVKSVVTAFGKHNRVVAFLPGFDSSFSRVTLYARVDHVNGLRDPEEKEILAVARKHQGVKGKYKLLNIRSSSDGKCTDYTFVPVKNLK